MSNVLPSALRTGHWYCDLHHSMLIIMFERLVPALRNNEPIVSGYFVDTMTPYWLLHCLMEEEGFAHALAHGKVAQDLVDRHAAAHLRLLETWRDDVFMPFKMRSADTAALADAAQRYYSGVLRHIETFDQDTYGAASGHDAISRSREIAHIAQAGLPLSPFMAGAMNTTRQLAPDLAAALAPRPHQPHGTPPKLAAGGPNTGLRAQLSQLINRRPTPLARLGQDLLAA